MLGKDVDLHTLPIRSIATAMVGDTSVPALRSRGSRNWYPQRSHHPHDADDDPQKATFWMAARHNYAHYMKYVDKDEPMPMAFAIGLHPVYEIMSNWSGKHEDFDELEYGAGILGEDIEMIKCDTIDLEVPAHAEVVIEGLVHPGTEPLKAHSENSPPSAPVPRGSCPRVRDYWHHAPKKPDLSAHAGDVVYRSPTADHAADGSHLLQSAQDTHGNTNILDVFVPPWASPVHDDRANGGRWDGQVRDTLMSALSGKICAVKVAMAVDEDVDIYSAEEVLWAIAARDPQTMAHVVPNTRLHPLDISIPQVHEDYTVMRVGENWHRRHQPATWRPEDSRSYASAPWAKAMTRSPSWSNRSG